MDRYKELNIYTDYKSFDEELKYIKWEYIEHKDKLYCNNIISFDIETSSLFCRLDKYAEIATWEGYKEEHKEEYVDYNALCYCWSVAIQDGECIRKYFGRTLESFHFFLLEIDSYTPYSHKIIYVHNLKYEFQFLRNIIEEWEVFARETYTPIYARTGNFEFRCSYLLTNQSLENWAKSKKLNHQKLVGSLDYLKVRTPYTNMTDEEIDYSLEDAVIVVEGLVEYKKEYKTVPNIPLTQTGRVRREVEQLMYKDYKWHDKMEKSYIKNLKMYRDQTDVFWGGLTRANRLHAGQVVHYLSSRDATSAYPWLMISKLFPVSDFIPSTEIDFILHSSNFCWYAMVEFYNINSKFWNSYIPADKCKSIKGAKLDNGRIISADYVKIRLLDIDFNIILRSYNIENYEISELYYALKGYLNDDFRRYVLTLFENKTQYKDVEGMEDLYARSKEMLNSLYGMMVTKLFTNEITFMDNNWSVEDLTLEIFQNKLDKILSQKYKLNHTFIQGAYVTAYQRESLWKFVEKFDELIVYMDTDSHKYYPTEDTEDYYRQYNRKVQDEYIKLAEQLNVNSQSFMPQSPSGKKSLLGQYTPERSYKEFKTLGAKRYAYSYKDEDECHVTVSGVNKKMGGLALEGDINNFKDGFVFRNKFCKKSTLHYLDNMGVVEYNKGEYDYYVNHARYGIAMHPAEYTMDLHEYKNLLLEVMRNKDKYTFKQLEKAYKGYEEKKN